MKMIDFLTWTFDRHYIWSTILCPELSVFWGFWVYSPWRIGLSVLMVGLTNAGKQAKNFI